MTSSLDMIRSRVERIKETLLVRVIENPSSFVSPSAYDTAWLAMVGGPKADGEKPMFESCLEWVLSNQKPEGFWGERDCHGNPTIDSLPATLACMVALKMWNLGHQHIHKGMAFLRENSATLLKRNDSNKEYPRWFAIVFPGMLELARRNGLEVMFANNEINDAVANAFAQQDHILLTENLVDKHHYPPLLSYLEALPSSYYIDQETIIHNLSDDGSLFQSPAATAAAYIATRNHETLSYLCNLVQNHDGVPSMYPIDEDCLKLYMINHLQRLGLSDHFEDEIGMISKEIYSQYNEQEVLSNEGFVQEDIFKSSLAFEVLRLQGYKVSPRRFCGLLKDEYALRRIERNHGMLASMLYNLYRATNVMFESEEEMLELRSLSRRLLEELHSSISNTMEVKEYVLRHFRQLLNI